MAGEVGRRWVSRDSDVDGELLPYVAVWERRPHRVECGLGAHWLSDNLDSPLDGWVESIWLPEASKRYRVVPDDDRQLIVVG